MIFEEFLFCADSLMGSGSEDEDDDEPHIRGPPLGLGPLGSLTESGLTLGGSDLSVQSMSTDSKTGHDDSDQVVFYFFFQNNLFFFISVN